MTTSTLSPITFLRSIPSDERTPERLVAEFSRSKLVSTLSIYAIDGKATAVGHARRSRLSLAESVLSAFEHGCRKTLRRLKNLSSLPAETFLHSHAGAYTKADAHSGRSLGTSFRVRTGR